MSLADKKTVVAAELKTPTDDAGAGTPAERRLGDPESWVEEHGDALFRYALVRLRDEALAEDMVQETLLAAFKAKEKFSGQSSPRSWLIGILKNKVIDHFRKASRETSFTDLEFFQDEQSEKFQPDGVFKDGWIHERGPFEWGSEPGSELDKVAFWKAFHDCSGKLPGNVSHVFLLREVEAVSTAEVCAIMNITPNHLWVMLHRARMALRQCLETNWFAKHGGKG